MVTVTYNLHIDDNEGEMIEQATAESPLQFLYGAGMMLPEFEKGLLGLKAGEGFEISLGKADAYGEVNENAIVDLPRQVFLVDGKFDDELVSVGNSVPMMSSNGHRLNGLVLEVGDETVRMDFNHPLAGEDLYFKGSVLEVREASLDEINQMMNGSCGCGSCGCDDDSCDSHGSGGCGCGC